LGPPFFWTSLRLWLQPASLLEERSDDTRLTSIDAARNHFAMTEIRFSLALLPASGKCRLCEVHFAVSPPPFAGLGGGEGEVAGIALLEQDWK
jgi:hypothetical protein